MLKYLHPHQACRAHQDHMLPDLQDLQPRAKSFMASCNRVIHKVKQMKPRVYEN